MVAGRARGHHGGRELEPSLGSASAAELSRHLGGSANRRSLTPPGVRCAGEDRRPAGSGQPLPHPADARFLQLVRASSVSLQGRGVMKSLWYMDSTWGCS